LRYARNISKQTRMSGSFAHGTVTSWQVRTYRTIGRTHYERLADAPEATATAGVQGPAAVGGLRGSWARWTRLGSIRIPAIMRQDAYYQTPRVFSVPLVVTILQG